MTDVRKCVIETNRSSLTHSGLAYTTLAQWFEHSTIDPKIKVSNAIPVDNSSIVSFSTILFD
jgi:hypothetical protein